MTKIRLPYIQSFADRHGKARYYFRKAGQPRRPLPGVPGSREFMDAYQDALKNTSAPIGRRTKEGSISALIEAYYNTQAYLRRADNTRERYRRIGERFREQFGENQVAGLRKEHVRALLHEMEATPAKAKQFLSVLRALMQLAIGKGWRTDDPTEGIKPIRHKGTEIHTWTDQEMDAFERRWPIGSQERLAYGLLLYTAQRKSDVIRLGPPHITNGVLNFSQKKTGVELWIPIHPKLDEVLRSTGIGRETFLITSQGRSWTAGGFSGWFRRIVEKAGLPKGCTPHGLRKAACVALAELGCTPHQIMAISGHSTLGEIGRYTRGADRKHLGKETMDQWARASRTKK